MSFIKAINLKHNFMRRDDEGEVLDVITALDGVDLEVEEGQFIAILGHNGSGKSTLAKHLNVLLSPTEGTLWVDDKDASNEERIWDIRQTAGMIFQNPDNQIVAGVVEEDVAFGPENVGVPTDEIWVRVAESLDAVGMSAYRYHSPNKLSGGQKQRVAIAGVVAMKPKCIIMDEPTAMLDPNGRQEVLKTVHRLNEEEGVTVILITHYMEEVVDADRVFVMSDGRIVLQGTPGDVFAQAVTLRSYGIDVPQVVRLADELREQGIKLPEEILNRHMLAEALSEVLSKDPRAVAEPVEVTPAPAKETKLKLEHVEYVYSEGSAYEIHALKDINLEIHQGEFVGMIGHTGSGKSTLIQLLNGLLKPTGGVVSYEGRDISDKNYSLQGLRSKVGLVFQYPEYQLFETTVLKDVCFGPKNQGASNEEAEEKAKRALTRVKLQEEFWEMSPFELSGGLKRRAAIAGVIAMEPDVLILDEPTAGLDPVGRDELFVLIRELHEEMGMTIILVSHSMEDVAEYVERIVVMNDGTLMLDGTPSEVFRHVEELEQAGLAVPQMTYLMRDLKNRGFSVSDHVTTLEEAKKEILKLC